VKIPIGYIPSKPARVVQWSDHLGAMCSRVWQWRAQWPRSGVQSEPWPGKVRLPTNRKLFENDSYAHDDQGDNPGQATEGSTVSCIKCDHCWHLD